MADENPLALLEHSAKLKLFVMLRRTVKPDVQRASLGDHLRWMIAAEKAGQIFLSGPIVPREGAAALDGLTLIRAASFEDAEAIAQGDPFVVRGIVAFELREWIANEGSLSVTVTLSDSKVNFS